tara:strand:+ start:552 stop:1304 length:753 start_codon:yes stop_codon:yes gene_type:complete
MVSLNEKIIYDHLKSLGIKQNDHILLYSKLSSLGIIEKNLAKKVLKYIIKYLGKDSTLVMPSYSFEQSQNSCFRINKLQNNYSTSILVKEFFKRNDIVRSFRLIHSHIGIGKKSSILKKNNNMNSFGKNSDFDLMKKNNFKCIFFGCMPSEAATYFFHLEYINKVPYRKKKYLKKKYKLKNQIKTTDFEYLSNDKLKKYNLNKSFSLLKKEGAKIKEVELKFGKSYSISLKDFHRFGNKLFKKDINFLIK